MPVLELGNLFMPVNLSCVCACHKLKFMELCVEFGGFQFTGIEVSVGM